MNEVINIIKNRRSVRFFTQENIDENILNEMILAAIYAPSGKNTQPWKFCVIKEQYIIGEIAKQMSFSKFISSAFCVIGVYYNPSVGYDSQKDYLSIGAAIQNILLSGCSLGVGTCWIGEARDVMDSIISKYYETQNLEPISLIAIGHIKKAPSMTTRKNIDQIIISRKES